MQWALMRVFPAPLRVSAFLFFAASLADGVLVPFFALWAVRDAGIPVAAAGLQLGCYAGGELVATPFVGGLSDRIGRRPVLIGSTLGVGCGFFVLYFAHGAVQAAVAFLMIGVFESVLHPTAQAVVADIVRCPICAAISGSIVCSAASAPCSARSWSVPAACSVIAARVVATGDGPITKAAVVATGTSLAAGGWLRPGGLFRRVLFADLGQPAPREAAGARIEFERIAGHRFLLKRV